MTDPSPRGTTPEWTYIVGFGRSGTTLLGMLLARSGGFCCGELHLLWEALVSGGMCQCGSLVSRCDVWATVAAQARSSLGLRSDAEGAAIMARRLRRRHLLLPRLPAPRPAELELRRATESATAAVTGARFLVDTSKLSSVLWTAAHIDRPLSVVHLVRDPRAVAFSQSRPKADPGRPGQGLQRRPVILSSSDWMRAHVTSERVIRRLVTAGRVERVLRIRYEDLVRDPDGCLAPLRGRTVPSAPALGEPATGHAVAGNPVRFDPLAVVPDERWHTEMRTLHRVVSTVVTAPMITHYGYSIRAVAGRT